MLTGRGVDGVREGVDEVAPYIYIGSDLRGDSVEECVYI